MLLVLTELTLVKYKMYRCTRHITNTSTHFTMDWDTHYRPEHVAPRDYRASTAKRSNSKFALRILYLIM